MTSPLTCAVASEVDQTTPRAASIVSILPSHKVVATLMSGLGVQAVNGATKAEMKRYAEMALRFMGY